MARIKLGPIVTDIRGRVKDMIFSIWKTGVHYIRSSAAIINNPESANQALIRDFMALAAKAWYDTLTDVQRANWNEFAAGLTPQEGDAGGILNLIPQNRGVMSGFNAYAMCRTMVRKCGIALPGTFNDSPLGQTPPSAVTGLTATWNTPNIDLTWVDPITVIEDSMIRIWIRSHENICHRQLWYCFALLALGASPSHFRGANGAQIAFVDAPGHYLFQADCIQPNGLKSPPSLTVEEEVT